MKKGLLLTAGIAAIAFGTLGLASCTAKSGAVDLSKKAITVISREEGSGTRRAFIELFGIEKKNAEGKKVDYTIDSADITNSTEVMLTSVAGNNTAIGYISLGSLNNVERT